MNDFERSSNWRINKSHLLLPIIYIRGYAGSGGEIDDTSNDPFNGFNIGSTLIRTEWTGDSARHIFESPVLRLMQAPYDYRLAFSDGLRGLDADTRDRLKKEGDILAGQPAEHARSQHAVIAIYRYYDAASTAFGEGLDPQMETFGWGLARLILDIKDATGARGVYLVAHSMGGLVARTFLQNPDVLDETDPTGRLGCMAVAGLLRNQPKRKISPAQWGDARAAVRRLFTYGTPHKGISAQGGLGNGVLSVGGALGLSVGNFARPEMRRYLAITPGEEVNSLDGRFPVDSTFCLVGTAAADYPVAWGMSRRLVGQVSDGLVEIDNAVAQGPGGPAGTELAARAYVRRAHSGPYGMVNSEEGFGNLTRFLFGDVRIDADLVIEDIGLPPSLAERVQAAKDAGNDAGVRASYVFESSLRVRGKRWTVTERLARDGSAILRRFDEIFPGKVLPAGIANDAQTEVERLRHRRIELFNAFLDTSMRTLDPDEPDRVGQTEVKDALGFALRLRVAVPDYEVEGHFWNKNHYEGSSLLNEDFVFLTFPDSNLRGGWGLAWGPNLADDTNSQLAFVEETRGTVPDAIQEDSTGFRLAGPDSLEFWLPLYRKGPPLFAGWLRLRARHWNQKPAPAAGQ